MVKGSRAPDPSFMILYRPFALYLFSPTFGENHGIFFPSFLSDRYSYTLSVYMYDVYVFVYVFMERSEDSLRYQSLSITLFEARSPVTGWGIFQAGFASPLTVGVLGLQMHASRWFLESQF